MHTCLKRHMYCLRSEVEKLLMHFWIDQLQMSKRSGVQCWLWWACRQLCTAVCRPATANISLRVSCLSGCVGTKIEGLNAARLHVGPSVHLWCVLVLCSYLRSFLTYCWQQNLSVCLYYFLLGHFLSKKLVQTIFFILQSDGVVSHGHSRMMKECSGWVHDSSHSNWLDTFCVQ